MIINPKYAQRRAGGGGSSLPNPIDSGDTPGSVLVWVGPGANDYDWVVLTSIYGILGGMFDGATSILEVGRFVDVVVPANCTITACEILCDPSGAIVFDIKKTTYALFPGSLTSIVASAPPTVISSGQKSLDTTLTGWTTALAANDILRFSITSRTLVTKASVSLKVLK